MSDAMLCLLSGGYDSVAALLWALDRGPTSALFVAYRQPYERQERAALQYLVDHGAVTTHPNWRGLHIARVDLQQGFESSGYVPYRNLVLASVAANWAVSLSCSRVVVGSKSAMFRADDPTSYLDSTSAFFREFDALVALITEPLREAHRPTTIMPLVGLTKSEVLEMIVGYSIDLRRLWNCYGTAGQPCGTCAHCRETLPLIASIEARS